MTLGATAAGRPLITAQELARHLRDADLLVLDATVNMPSPRFDGDYRATSGESRWLAAHIPGSRFADLLGELSDHEAPYHFAVPRPAELVRAFRSLGVDDTKRVVVYDSDSGLWAARVWWMLRSVGIHAAILDGGFKEWRRQDQPIESGKADVEMGGVVTASPDPVAWVDRATVEAIVRGESPGTLVCALSPDLFKGTVPTRYHRRGHIPRSLNFPARELFGADGAYLPSNELNALVQTALAGAQRPLVLYCGGGISAAATALALCLLGETEVSIYDGSLEEWSADRTLPLVTMPGVISKGVGSRVAPR